MGNSLYEEGVRGGTMARYRRGIWWGARGRVRFFGNTDGGDGRAHCLRNADKGGPLSGHRGFGEKSGDWGTSLCKTLLSAMGAATKQKNEKRRMFTGTQQRKKRKNT